MRSDCSLSNGARMMKKMTRWRIWSCQSAQERAATYWPELLRVFLDCFCVEDLPEVLAGGQVSVFLLCQKDLLLIVAQLEIRGVVCGLG